MNEVELRVVWGKMLPRYATTAPFPFRDHRGKEHTVPAGFSTDGASFPWWLKYVGSIVMLVLLALGYDGWTAFLGSIVLQSLIGAPLHRAYADAAVAHDYLYWLGAPKAFADCVFFRMIVRRARILRWTFLLEHHRNPLARPVADVVIAYRIARAVVMYGGVLVGGVFAYSAHRRRRRRENALSPK